MNSKSENQIIQISRIVLYLCNEIGHCQLKCEHKGQKEFPASGYPVSKPSILEQRQEIHSKKRARMKCRKSK